MIIKWFFIVKIDIYKNRFRKLNDVESVKDLDKLYNRAISTEEQDGQNFV